MRASVMHAAGEPDVLRYEQVPDPVPAADEVLIEIAAIGLQGGDRLYRQFGYGVKFPHIVGYQASGTIREVGAEVDLYRPGDHVVALMPSGSHAELATVTQNSVFALPDGMDFRSAAAALVEFGTASEAVSIRGALQPGESVLITAATGGVGSAAVQLARRGGAYPVIAMTGADTFRDELFRLGADVVVSHRSDDLASQLLSATEGRGVDLVVDAVAGRVLEASMQALAAGGRIAWIGRAATTGVEAHPDPWAILVKNADVRGVHFGNAQAREPERVSRMVHQLLTRIHQGDLEVLVDREFPLSRAADAHAYVEDRQAIGRVLILPGS